MHLSTATEASEELFLAMQTLIPQLTANHPAPTRDELKVLVASPGTTLLVARHPDEDGAIVGAAALIIYHVPTGVRARIEDVVVDGGARGLGIGAALTLEALRLAREARADGVALSSHPRRVAANQLYQKLGFRRWETNLYFYKF